MACQRRGFSLVELIVVVLFVGVLAAIAMPRMNFAVPSKYKAETTARKIVTDLRRARRLAISDAATNTHGFGIRMNSPSPYQSYEIRKLSPGETLETHTIDTDVQCTGGHWFKFGPTGSLKNGSDTELTVSAAGKSLTITITTATGIVKCAEN